MPVSIICYCSTFKGVYQSEYTEFQNIHVHIAYYHCATDQIENSTPKMLISRFKIIHYDYFDSYHIVKTPITQNSKVTCFVNWRKQ